MKTIAIGFLALALAHGSAAAQTAGEQAQILRDFQQSVATYTAATPAPRIFTLPVAMVFRQLIARSLAERDGVAAINGLGSYAHLTSRQPIPSKGLYDFPRSLQAALPPVPAPLEYRLIGHDIVVRDHQAGIVVDVLRNAVGPGLTMIR